VYGHRLELFQIGSLIASQAILQEMTNLTRNISNMQPSVINLRIGAISVGATFQPRLNDYSFRAISFRGWKATPTKI
jgi:hypothetical protein